MTNTIFNGLGIPSGAATQTAGRFIAFQPDPDSGPPFSFICQLAEGQAQINILWNSVGMRYWVEAKDANGDLLTSFPLVATPSENSPLKIDLLIGVSRSSLYFYEDIQSFHLITP